MLTLQIPPSALYTSNNPATITSSLAAGHYYEQHEGLFLSSSSFKHVGASSYSLKISANILMFFFYYVIYIQLFPEQRECRFH